VVNDAAEESAAFLFYEELLCVLRALSALSAPKSFHAENAEASRRTRRRDELCIVMPFST
jgi:hypothetical protein